MYFFGPSCNKSVNNSENCIRKCKWNIQFNETEIKGKIRTNLK